MSMRNDGSALKELRDLMSMCECNFPQTENWNIYQDEVRLKLGLRE